MAKKILSYKKKVTKKSTKKVAKKTNKKSTKKQFKKLRTIKQLELMADVIREDIVAMLFHAKSGHSAGALGMADILTALYFNVLNHNPKKPKDKARDRFILSNGHTCPVLYATLANAGYFPKKELLTLRKLGSRLQGHPHRTSLPGVETSSGPLGSGLSQAAGMATVFKREKTKQKVFVIAGDGEQNEGNHWEAVMYAAKEKLHNLIAITDRNYIQIDGNTETIMPLDQLEDKYLAFNWNVVTIDGNDMEQVLSALKASKSNSQKPLMIIANTTPGKGVSFMEGDYHWHGKAPKDNETQEALRQIHQHECLERGDWYKMHSLLQPVHLISGSKKRRSRK